MSETTECAKRAVRIKALRAKADSTEYPAEAATLRDKADELQAKNDAVGYVDPAESERRQTVFDSFWEEYMRDVRKKGQDERIKLYQEYIRRHESGQTDCVHKWVFLRSTTHGPICHCEKCGKTEQRVWAPGGTASSYEEHYVGDEVPPTRMKSRRTQSTGERRTRTDHSECYANGWHDKSKAGRAQCRRGTA